LNSQKLKTAKKELNAMIERWSVVCEYVRPEKFDTYNPKHDIALLNNFLSKKIDRREFLSQVIELDVKRYHFYMSLDLIFDDATIMVFDDLEEAMYALAMPYAESKLNLPDRKTYLYEAKNKEEYQQEKAILLDYMLDDDIKNHNSRMEYIEENKELYRFK